MQQKACCRGCGAYPLKSVLNLGPQPPSNAYKIEQFAKEIFYPLELVICPDCQLLQTGYDVPPETIFGSHYAYFSQNSHEWLEHTKDYCDMIYGRLALGSQSKVVEIGGNDGHLLVNLKDRVERAVNIEPSGSVAEASIARGVETRVEFFDKIDFKADLIIANNVMAHTPYLRAFVDSLARSLAANGTITIEFPHALEMIKGVQFDTIYHEHYSYLSLTALSRLFSRYDLHIYDVERLPTHGGSLRAYVGYNQRIQDIVSIITAEERRSSVHYDIFARRAAESRQAFLYWLDVGDGGRPGQLQAYGAAAKGNTFLNYCGVTQNEIPMVADTTLAKQGLYLPGSCIPIVSEQAVFDADPRWIMILPWNWSHEIVQRIRRTRPQQRFVVGVPTFQEITPVCAL